MALSYMVADEIRSGQLAPVLVDYLPPAEPIHLVYPQSKIVAPKVRSFVDFAADRLTDAIGQSELVLS